MGEALIHQSMGGSNDNSGGPGDDLLRRDRDVFKNQYKSEIDKLTKNNKNTITLLTELAKDNVWASDIIVDLINNRLINARPEFKILTLYLLDSICKNLSKETPYIKLFTRDLVNIFLRLYVESSENTRAVFLKVFRTWNNIFDRETLKRISDGVSRIKMTTPRPITTVESHLKQPGGTTRDSFSMDARFAQSMDYGGNMNTIQGMKGRYTHPVQVQDPNYMRQYPYYPYQGGEYYEDMNMYNSMYPQMPPSNQPIYMGQQGYTSAQPPYTTQPSYPGVDLQENIGQVRGKRTATDAVHEDNTHKRKMSDANQPNKNVAESLYNILYHLEAIDGKSFDNFPNVVSLKYEVLQQRIPGSYKYLYDRFPLQCYTCGSRFKKDDQIEFDSHLDNHYEVANRANKNNLLIRGWFLDGEKWVSSLGNEANDLLSVVDTFKKTKDDDESDFPNKSTLLREDTNKCCTVCNEKIDMKWDQNTDNWITDENVVLDDDNKVVHASCKEYPGDSSEAVL